MKWVLLQRPFFLPRKFPHFFPQSGCVCELFLAMCASISDGGRDQRR
jgi:hypothetical protein